MSSYAKMTVADLKAELKKKGLDTNGLKKDLVERLEASGETANPEKEEKEEKAAPKKAATRGKKRKAEEVEEEEDEDPAPSKEEARHEAASKKFKVDNSSKKAPSSVPVDSVCQRKHPHTKSAHVYIDGDVVWGVMLNQTNISQNNNKYYVIQVLENGGSYYTYNRWGRVGDDGQDSLGGPMGLAAAKKDFEKKFKDKTKNSWDDGAARSNFTKFNGKYDLLEMDFGDDEPASAVVEKTASGKKAVVKPCTLDAPTQSLVRLICDNDMFKQQLVTFNIDVKRMPLGKLSKEQLAKGFEVLEELMEEVKAGKTSNCEKLSSRFYTVIPHEYSRSQVPPVLKQQEAIQEKMNMLEVLGDIVIAQSMLKDVDAGNSEEVDHPLDANYKKIGNELTTLNRNSKEFKIIEKYFENTKTQGSNAKLLDVWSLDRKGEKKRADKYKDIVNRKLLWHGTKVAVMVAILRDGLRIMPHSGGRVGRGIYSASENAKSAGYVGTAMDQGKNIGLMFLNEVILGTEHHIKQDDSSLISAPKGCHSVIALGRREPDSKDDVTIDGEWHPITVPAGKAVNTPHTSSSFFNTEYLVYDEAQVRQKYLLKIQF